MVARAGLSIGRINEVNILKSPAPSILPDSVISWGMAFTKFFINMISQGDISRGSATAR